MGITLSLMSQSWPPPSKFSVDDIPDLSGKVIIVTGGNTGIGRETAKALLAHNAKVYIAARSEEKVKKAIQDLQEVTGQEAFFLKLDLADLKSVKAAAQEFLSKETELHVLFNNAGVLKPPIDQLTVDGYDLTFGTNVLGHFFFTKLLLPTMISTAQSLPDGKARVVNVSSVAHLVQNLNFNSFRDGPARRKMGNGALYNQSKFGNVVFATELARRYSDQGIVSTSLNPGNIRTDLQRNQTGLFAVIIDLIVYDPSYGALTQLWAGTSEEGATFNGKYLIPWARFGTPRADSQSPELGRTLWTWLEEQVENI